MTIQEMIMQSLGADPDNTYVLGPFPIEGANPMYSGDGERVLLAFKSGVICSAIEFPADQIDTMIDMLKIAKDESRKMKFKA